MKKLAQTVGTFALIGVAVLGLGACSTVDQQARDQAAAALSAAQRAESAANAAAAAARDAAEKADRIYQRNLRK